jgi:NAD(P)-dependent dehydrogenase (short-subunit alcohol dehydrogenase family)
MAEFDTSAVPDYGRRMRLDGRVFIVIGAGQGIGRQSAHGLAQMGAQVACVGRGREMTEQVARETGGTAFLGDANRRGDIERVFAEVKARYGKINGVVDIIGEPVNKGIDDLTEEDWDWQFQNVLKHAFHALQLGGRAVAEAGGGAIVLVGSTAGLAATRQAAYGAAKAGLHHLIKSAGVEFGPKGVRVNAVAPGFTRTPRIQGRFAEDRQAEMAKAYPLQRLAEPCEIASAILFMASDLSSDITGQTLVVDGGLTAQIPRGLVR